MKDPNKEIESIVQWLKDKVSSAGAKGLVFGLSGGIDSAVIAGISKLAFPNESLGVIMPINSNVQDESDALLVAKTLDLDTINIDLSGIYQSFLKSLPFEGENPMAKANLKPRLRMMTLYFFAQEMNYLVCGSSNKSELEIGYFTKYGDSGVDLLPLADFVKSEVRQLAEELKIPRDIIIKPPTAGLWEGQTDEKELGFSYDVLDKYIITGEGPEDIVEKIKELHNKSQHKREFPPIYKKIGEN